MEGITPKSGGVLPEAEGFEKGENTRKRNGVILAIGWDIVFFFGIEGRGADWTHCYSDAEND